MENTRRALPRQIEHTPQASYTMTSLSLSLSLFLSLLCFSHWRGIALARFPSPRYYKDHFQSVRRDPLRSNFFLALGRDRVPFPSFQRSRELLTRCPRDISSTRYVNDILESTNYRDHLRQAHDDHDVSSPAFLINWTLSYQSLVAVVESRNVRRKIFTSRPALPLRELPWEFLNWIFTGRAGPAAPRTLRNLRKSYTMWSCARTVSSSTRLGQTWWKRSMVGWRTTASPWWWRQNGDRHLSNSPRRRWNEASSRGE